MEEYEDYEPDCSITEDQGREKIQKARSQLLLDQPFFGSLSLYLKLNEVPKPFLEAMGGGTMGTDGNELIYCREFVEETNLAKIQAIIAHEVMHLGLGHLWRRGTRNKMKFNISTDYAINSILDNEGFDLGDHSLINHKFDNMSAEEIYEELPDPPNRGGGEPECPKCGSDDITKKKLTVEDNGKGKAEYKCNDCGHEWEEDVIVTDDPSSRGGQQAVPWEEVEDHRQDAHGKWGEASRSGDEEDEEKGMTPSEIESKRKEMEQEWKRRMVESAESAKMQGNVPAGMERVIEDLTEPKLDWRTLLQRCITQVARNDYTFRRPNERYGVIYPKLRNPEVSAAIGIDTSGSISEKELQAFMSEIKGITNSFDDFNLLLMAGDTEIYNEKEANTVSEIEEFHQEAGGGGGTDYRPFFKRTEEKGEYDILVILGDSFGQMPEKKYDFQTLWIFSSRDSKEIPFGTKTFLDVD